MLQTVAIAVGFSNELNNPSFVREPIKKGRCQGGIGKNRVPVTKAQIAGNDHRNLLIEVTDKLKQQLRSCLVYGNEPQFVQDEKI